jgi:hypothetical protein
MDRVRIEEHLNQAEQHITLGMMHISRPQQIIAELQRDGHDTTDAEALLATLEETQRLHLSGRETILDELRSA